MRKVTIMFIVSALLCLAVLVPTMIGACGATATPNPC